jgi:hypothetical protein
MDALVAVFGGVCPSKVAMNHKLFSGPVVIVITVWLLAACMPASPPGGANCQSGICVDIQLSEPIHFNEPVTATITVETDQDVPQLGVSLWGFSGVTVDGTGVWEVNAKAHQPVNFTGTIRFTQEGYVTVIGDAITLEGRRVVDSVSVYISQAGGTVNPSAPTGPFQAVPYTPQPTRMSK